MHNKQHQLNTLSYIKNKFISNITTVYYNLSQYIYIFFATTCACNGVSSEPHRPPMHHHNYQYASSFVSMHLNSFQWKITDILHSTHFLITQLFNSTESNLLIEMYFFFCLSFTHIYIRFQLLHLFAYIFHIHTHF